MNPKSTLKKIEITFMCGKCKQEQKMSVNIHNFGFERVDTGCLYLRKLSVDIKCNECGNFEKIDLI